jgi:predicted nucleic-acid-binding Zn-ribbon protein
MEAKTTLEGTYAGGFHQYMTQCPDCKSRILWVSERLSVKVEVSEKGTTVLNLFEDDFWGVTCAECGWSSDKVPEGGNPQ